MVTDFSNHCPTYQLCANSSYVPLTKGLGKGPTAISLVSCTLSCLGSLLIVATYVRWKDIRTGSRSIIVFLAIADFVTAAGYILGGINYLVHSPEYSKNIVLESCRRFETICEIQSYITSWSSLSSFVWTTALALYLYITVVLGRIYLAASLIPVFHVVAWGVPILILLPLLITDNLGFSPAAASDWCYIKDQGSAFGDVTAKGVFLLFIAGKLWEISSYVVVIVLYGLIKWHIHTETRNFADSFRLVSSGLVAAVQKVDRKLIFIPVVFILLRMWGTLQMFYYFAVAHRIDSGNSCIDQQTYAGFIVFGYLQGLGDGGQGWGNVILYIFISKKMRKRVFGWIGVLCLRLFAGKSPSQHRAVQTPHSPLNGHQSTPARLVPPPSPHASDTVSVNVHYTKDQDRVSMDYEPTTIIDA